MITPFEIRIGNYLLHDGKPVKVLGISITEDMRGLNKELHSHKIAIAEPYCVFQNKWISQFEPIPLDRLMLSKLGFNALHLSEQGTIISNVDGLFQLSPDYDHTGVFELIWDMSFTGKKISALHELQNHFFYFTGIELTQPEN